MARDSDTLKENRLASKRGGWLGRNRETSLGQHAQENPWLTRLRPRRGTKGKPGNEEELREAAMPLLGLWLSSLPATLNDY